MEARASARALGRRTPDRGAARWSGQVVRWGSCQMCRLSTSCWRMGAAFSRRHFAWSSRDSAIRHWLCANATHASPLNCSCRHSRGSRYAAMPNMLREPHAKRRTDASCPLAECSIMPRQRHAPDLTARATADVEKVRRAGRHVRVAVVTGQAWWNLEAWLAPPLHEGRNGCR